MADWHTCERYQRLGELTRRRPIGEADLEQVLADHDAYPSSICSHPSPLDAREERSMTIAAVVLDLTAGTLAVTNGPPCGARYEVVALAD
jgi:isopenicillin-N N-acyltransferase like protein